jgi:hypothetical protein
MHFNISIDLGNIWDALSALGTIGAVILALFLPSLQRMPRLRVNIKEVEKGYAFRVENIGQKFEYITRITFKFKQGRSLFVHDHWREYNFFAGDNISDTFNKVWNKEYHDKARYRHRIQPQDSFAEQNSSLIMGLQDWSGTKSIDDKKAGKLWVEIQVEGGKIFKSNKIRTHIH